MFHSFLADLSFASWLYPWVFVQVIESSLLLGVIAALWWLIRHRASPQFGYWMFLLVLVKLMLPMPIPGPNWIARLSPHSMTRQWIQPSRTPQPVSIDTLRPDGSDSLEVRSERRGRELNSSGTQAVSQSSPPTHEDRSPVVGSEQILKSLDKAPIGRLDSAEVTTKSSSQAVSWSDFIPNLEIVLVASWALTSLALMIVFCMRHLAFGRRVRDASPISPSEMKIDWQELCRTSGLRKCPPIVELSGVSGPAVFGLVHPVVVLPQGFRERLDSKELSWCLLHELAHIQRGDLWISLFQRFVAMVFWFHPAVWLTNRCIDQLREYACDEQATRRSRQTAIESSSAFLSVLKATYPQPTTRPKLMLGIFGWEDRRECMRRIERLLDADDRKTHSKWILCPVLLLVAGVFLPQLRAVDEPQFVARGTETTGTETTESGVEGAIVTEEAEERRIELLVVGENQQAIPGLVVELVGSEAIEAQQLEVGEQAEERARRLRVRTDKEGRIVLRMPKEFQYFAVFVEAQGYAPYWSEWRSQNTHAPPAKHTIELDDGWVMGGVLVDEEGKPIANAKLQPSIQFKRRTLDQIELHIGTEVTTDDEGRWSYGSAPANKESISVTVRHPSFQPKVLAVERTRYEIRSNEQRSVKDVLSRGLAVTGRVFDDQGKPVVGAIVRGRFVNDERSAVSQEDGSYRLQGCTPGRTRIVVSAKRYATDMKLVEVSANATTCDFELQPGGRIRIRVMDEDGKPVPRARIFFQEWRGRFEYWEFDHIDQYANQKGVWEWNEAPLDEFKADICGPNGMLSSQPLIARDDEYVFVPPSWLTISGKVRDAVTGKPIPEFRVIPGRRGPNGWEHWEREDTLQGTGGSYTIKIRPSSDERSAVRIEADGYLPKNSRDIENDEGRVTLNLTLEPAKTVELRLLTPDGQHTVDAKVAISGQQAQFRIESGELQRNNKDELCVTDRDGRCRLTLPGESFHILATHASGYAIVHSLPNQELNEIRLLKWGEVNGESRRGKTTLAGSTVQLQLLPSFEQPEVLIESSALVRIDQNGMFRFEKVIPGMVRVMQLPNQDSSGLELPGQSWLSQPVEVRSGEPTKITLGGMGPSVRGKLKKYSGRTRISIAIETPANPLPKIAEEISRDPEKSAQWWDTWLTSEEGKAWNARNEENNQLLQQSPYYLATVDENGSFQIDGVAPGRYKADALLMDALSSKLESSGSGVNPFLGHFMIEVPSESKAELIDLGVVELKPNQQLNPM